VARSAGFCFGVRRAIAIADETARSSGAAGGASEPIQSLGPVIHNPQVVRDLEAKGLRVAHSVEEIGRGKVVIRSHGITRADRETLETKGVSVIDATCPFVTKAQEHARALSREGYAVVVVGDPDHPEVRSIVSYIEPGVPVITSLEELRRAKGIRKAGIVAQTTQSFDRLAEFVGEAVRRFPEVRIFNTICNATALRQRESKAVAARSELMIVVGGYNSANTRRLAEICRAVNAGTIHIETADELPADRVAGLSRVGVTAGASTPEWIIEGLVERIRQVWRDDEVAVSLYG